MKRLHLGELGESAFLHKAVTLGFHVSKPFAVERYDFVVAYGPHLWRVQVKSSRYKVRDVYVVNSAHTTRLGVQRYEPSQLDFFAMYIQPEDTWYIIPARIVCPYEAVRLYSRARHQHPPRRHRGRPGGKFERYREAWHLLCGEDAG